MVSRRATPSSQAPATPRTVARATAALAAADPVIALMVERFGPCRLVQPRILPGSLRTGPGTDADGHLSSLIESILYQQLAGKAAAAIHARLVSAIGGQVSANAVLAAGTERLRAAGLSGAKARAILGLCAAVETRSIDLGKLATLTEDEIEARLVALPGIGPWTAEMFLMFRLGRLDVWPATDLGVRRGYALAFHLPELPKPAELRERGETWRPWRSVVAWYCWRVAEAGAL